MTIPTSWLFRPVAAAEQDRLTGHRAKLAFAGGPVTLINDACDGWRDHQCIISHLILAREKTLKINGPEIVKIVEFCTPFYISPLLAEVCSQSCLPSSITKYIFLLNSAGGAK
jgi:hypothetical protein